MEKKTVAEEAKVKLKAKPTGKVVKKSLELKKSGNVKHIKVTTTIVKESSKPTVSASK